MLLNSTRSNGETHFWNTGQITPSIYASTSGLYINDVNWKGCLVKDSFHVIQAAEPWMKKDTTICLPFNNFQLNATTPGAQSYSWQNGAGGATHNVTAPGIYWVNIWNGSCNKKDSLTVITSAAPKDSNSTVSICSGQGYTLPWGVTVTTSGIYRDTIRYAAGCDSLRQSVNVSFATAASTTLAASVCSGQTYTLPWGMIASASGTYRDTLRNI